MAPLLIDTFVTARTDVAMPAQTLFGPAAFVAYLWMRRRYGPERTMQEFLASTDVPSADSQREPSPQAQPPAVASTKT